MMYSSRTYNPLAFWLCRNCVVYGCHIEFRAWDNDHINRTYRRLNLEPERTIILISHFSMSDVNKLALLTISQTTSVLSMIASSSAWGTYCRVWGLKRINYLCRGKMYDALIQSLARPFVSLKKVCHRKHIERT
jgi:hypothetical protein